MTRNISIWARGTQFPEPEALGRDLATEVCVVGAGIAGVTTAYLLAKEGMSVAVLDRGALLSGQTRNTTAHLSNAIDDRYSMIEQMHGAHGARLAAESHSSAIDRIERIVAEEKIDCDFARVDGYLFLGEGHKGEILVEELEAAHRAGLGAVEKLDQAPVRGFMSGPCLRFPRQGQFHPLRYLSALIERCDAMGVRFFANTPVEDVRGGPVAMVKTKIGFTVKAKAAVVTTNSPINNRVKLHSKLYPYLSFVVGGLVKKGAVERALFWDTLEMYHYVRLQDWDEERDMLIVGGADHKTGHRNDASERYAQLEAWARRRFPGMEEVVLRWSGQVLETPDGLAFIGKNPGEENVYLCTGDSGMGMTHGTISAILNTDLIQGRANPWATLYDPRRKTLRALPAFAEENLDVALQFGDYFTPGGVESEEEIGPGSGAVVRRGLTKLAVYRDELGKLHRRSAVCPHLGCIVAWNSDKRTWDCPCHGSRFDPLGKVVNGPAVSDLSET